MSLIMRSRDSSARSEAEPTTMSAVARSLRSLLAVNPSQNKLMPPATTGIEAERVVFICHGASPALGSVASLCAFSSTADTTRSTNTLLSSATEGAPKKSTPSGMLNETKWSGMEAGLTHMAAAGPQAWVSVSLKLAMAPQDANSLAGELVYSTHLWCKLPAASASVKNVPLPARTESSGINPELVLTPYLDPRVKVTFRADRAVARLVRARKVTVFVVYGHEPHVNVLKERVIVDPVCGHREKTSLLDMDRCLRGERVEHPAGSRWFEGHVAKEEVDGVLNAHSAFQEPSLGPQLSFVHLDCRRVLSDKAVQHSRLPAKTPSGNRPSGLGVVASPELSSMFGFSEPPGHSSGYTEAPPVPVTAEVGHARVEGRAEAAGRHSDREGLDRPVRGSVVADAARKLGWEEAVKDGVVSVAVVVR
eukprot:3764510-Rhodomonas_salina.1